MKKVEVSLSGEELEKCEDEATRVGMKLTTFIEQCALRVTYRPLGLTWGDNVALTDIKLLGCSAHA